jgi:hypothetical protein
VREQVRDLNDYFDPTMLEMWAYLNARRWHEEFERYGFPYPGTVRDQPYVWRLAVDCHKDATAEAQVAADHDANEARREKEAAQEDY